MKKIIFGITVLILTLAGCKYEEGSAFTNVEKRIKGIWSISSIYKNGEKTDTESPTVVESQNAVYEFHKTKLLLISYVYGDIAYQSPGSWSFGDKKKTIELTFKNQYYDLNRSYEIVKFTNKELKVRFTDDYGVKWTLDFTLEYLFSPNDL